MSLAPTFAQVKNTVARSRGTYVAARPRHAALGPFDGPPDVLAAFGRSSPLTVAERDAVVVALVREHQASPHPLWQSLLLGAFEPMLVRLRKRLGRPRDEDLDQRVLLAFLGAVRRVRVGAYSLLAVRWATEEELFAGERASRRGPPTSPFDEETHPCDPFDVGAEARASAAEIARWVEAAGGDELLDALLSDRSGSGSLKDYVDRTYAGCSHEARAAAYYRLRTARTRVISEIRTRVAPRARVA